MQAYRQPGTDRDRQDQIIRYLSDASARSAAISREFLDAEQASRAARFSRFLARRYYRDRLNRGFRYSARLGYEVAALANAAEFDAILDTCILGSFATATKVGDLACAYLTTLRTEVWWRELLEYERAFFLQLATSEVTPPASVPRRNVSAICREFQVPISEVITNLRSGAEVADNLQSKAKLLFSRTNHGKIYVAEVDETTARVFEEVDGTKSAGEIAENCALRQDEALRILTTFSEIGSIVLPSSHDFA